MIIHTLALVMCTAAQDPTTMMVETPIPPVEEADAVPASVAALLAGYETSATPAQWNTLPAQDRGALVTLVKDARQPLTRRIRALDGLRVVDPARARDVARSLARSDGEDPALRADAARVLGTLLSPEALLLELKPVLEGASVPALRVAVAQELVKTRRGPACRAVQAQRAREADPARLWKDVPTGCK